MWLAFPQLTQAHYTYIRCLCSMFSLGKQIPYISACVCSELCVRLRSTVCRCRPCFVFYALSKERSSLSQHRRTHTIASQLSFASQLPMGYPPHPLAHHHNTLPCTSTLTPLFFSCSSVQSWPQAWHTAKTAILATPDAKLAFPRAGCVCVIDDSWHYSSSSMVEGVCAVVMVNESGQPCLKELLFWYFPFLCIYETKCSVTQILAVECVQVFPVKTH